MWVPNERVGLDVPATVAGAPRARGTALRTLRRRSSPRSAVERVLLRIARTGEAAHRPEPLLEIAPADARAAGLKEGGLAWVESSRGRLLLRVAFSEAQVSGQVFLPIHWSDSNASAAVVGRLVGASTTPGPPGVSIPVDTRIAIVLRQLA